MINQQTRQASLECTTQSDAQKARQANPRVHIARKAIPGFDGETSWIKGTWQNPRKRRGGKGEKERRNSQEAMGNIGSQSRNKPGYTHVAGS